LPPAKRPGARLAVSPLQLTVERGLRATFIVTLQSIDGIQRRRVTVRANPAGQRSVARLRLLPQPVTLLPDAAARSTLTIETSRLTPIGVHPITIEGRFFDGREQAVVLLTVH
jgi:hypothetical protein